MTDDLEGKLRITRSRVQRGPVEESVTGSGSMSAAEGDWRTFSFTARRYADGTVDGQWQRVRRQNGNAADSKSHAVVTCFRIVDDQAWLGGYATGGMNSVPPNGVAWRVVDNGQGAASSPDQMSAQYYSPNLSFPAAYCAHSPDDPALSAIEAGNIRISR